MAQMLGHLHQRASAIAFRIAKLGADGVERLTEPVRLHWREHPASGIAGRAVQRRAVLRAMAE